MLREARRCIRAWDCVWSGAARDMTKNGHDRKIDAKISKGNSQKNMTTNGPIEKWTLRSPKQDLHTRMPSRTQTYDLQTYH